MSESHLARLPGTRWSQAALGELQVQQRAHDERCHQDIAVMPHPERLKHLVLHIAKYVGRVAGEQGENEGALARTIVDTTIIALSAANVLGMDLSARPVAGRVERGEHALRRWLLFAFADINGRMAKACEAYDHMETVSYKPTLAGGVADLLCCCQQAANELGVDLDKAVNNRWREIQSAAARSAGDF